MRRVRARVRNHKELLSGAFFAALGLVTVVAAQHYRTGSITAMGPGYFPTVLGGLLIVLGAINLGRAVVLEAGEPGEERGAGIPWRSLLLITAAITAFGAVFERAGLLAAVLVTVALSCLANRRLRPLEALAIFAVVALLAAALFVYGLGFPAVALLPH